MPVIQRLPTLVLLSAVGVAGCSVGESRQSARSAVEAIAGYELDCSSVRMVPLGDELTFLGSYARVLGAEGCGRRAVYVLTCVGDYCDVEVE